MASLTAKTPAKDFPKFFDMKKFFGDEAKDIKISSIKDVLGVIERIPADKEGEIPDDVINFYNHHSGTELPPDSVAGKQYNKRSTGGREKWNGEGQPFREGTKYHRVFKTLIEGTHSRQDLIDEFTKEFGEKTGSPSNMATYIGTVARKVEDQYSLEKMPDGKLILKKAN